MMMRAGPAWRPVHVLALAAALSVAGIGSARAQVDAGTARDAHVARPLPPGVQVPEWNQLDADRQRAFAGLADRWNDMPASRRVQLLERYERWVRMPPDQREQLRTGERNFHHLSPAQRERMRRSFRAMRELPPDEQQRLRATWRAMNPEQRRAWLERGGPGIVPPP
jgi:hypothetical protein